MYQERFIVDCLIEVESDCVNYLYLVKQKFSVSCQYDSKEQISQYSSNSFLVQPNLVSHKCVGPLAVFLPSGSRVAT